MLFFDQNLTQAATYSKPAPSQPTSVAARLVADIGWAYQVMNQSHHADLRQQGKFLLRTLLHFRASASWFRFLRNSYLHDIAHTEPGLIEAIHRPFFDKNICAKHRVRLLKGHFELLPSLLGSRQAGDVMSGNRVQLCQFEGKHGEQCSLMMLRDDAFKREGGITLALNFDGQTLLYLTFTMLRQGQKTVIKVGGIQSSKHCCRDMLRKATHSLHGIQPRLLLIEALRGIAQQMDCSHIECISKLNHIYGAWRYRLKKIIHAEYDQLWLLAGATVNNRGNFDLPLSGEQKPIESRPSNKRSEYRRRGVLLESIQQQLRLAR